MEMSARSIPRPEYPRPQFVRKKWMNLNGEWEFCFDDADQGMKLGWEHGLPVEQKIIVPFPYQCELSGINDKSIHEIVWYSRAFEVPKDWHGMNLLLHFGAVDYQCTVWVNGKEVGHNQGGHTPFSFNIAPYLNPDGNRVAVRVVDRQDAKQPRGKQSVSGTPMAIDYYCSTGIWQTVWLEPVPPIRIDELRIFPSAQHSSFDLMIYLHAPSALWRVEAEALREGDMVARSRREVSAATVMMKLAISDAALWTPDSPNLYDIRLRLYNGEELLDEVCTYGGLRDIELTNGCLYLNGHATYMRLVLDQGYWPESYLAAPSSDALRADVEWTKRFGFNGARKHQKIEDPIWLYWCDRLGLLVWEEMPNAREWSSQAEEKLAAEWSRAVQRDVNHPCIVAWVPVNESMGFPGLKDSHPGQYAFIERMVNLTRQIDSSRAVIDNDGWEHTDITDICAIHDYTPTASLLRQRYKGASRLGGLPPHVWLDEKPLFVLGSCYRGQPVVLSEVGGLLELSPKAKKDLDMLFNFYGHWETEEQFLERYRDLMEGISSLDFLAGFCYTQLTDIEQETNGLLTYDRKPKLDPEKVFRVNKTLFR